MPITVRLPEELERRVEVLASETGRKKSYYIKEALVKYLDDMEDVYLAERTLERVRSGEEPVYTLDEVERDLGLAD